MVRRYLEETVYCAPENASDLEARADISEAMGHLPKTQRAAIFKKYALKEPLVTPGEKSAESRGITELTHRVVVASCRRWFPRTQAPHLRHW